MLSEYVCKNMMPEYNYKWFRDSIACTILRFMIFIISNCFNFFPVSF